MPAGAPYDPVKDIAYGAGNESSSNMSRGSSHYTTTRRCRFFELPAELRIAIYKLLFCAPKTIVIGPTNRQVPSYRVVLKRRAGEHIALFLDMPSFPRLPVAFLATCRQINREATKILYGENDFLIEHIIPLGRNQDPDFGGYVAHNFFLWHLRQFTLSHILSIGFTAACRCGKAAFVDAQTKTWWKADSSALSGVLFPHAQGGDGFLQGGKLAAPETLREVFAGINHSVMLHLGWLGPKVRAGHSFECECKKWTL